MQQNTSSVTGSAKEATSATSDPLRLDVVVKEDGDGNVLLSVIPPDTGAPPRLDVCIVIDTSGSMSEAANPSGTEEVKLFSKMDLAKRGAEVIVRSLGPNDTVTVLGFESRVTKWLPRTFMDRQGSETALAALASLQPGGGTALWDALHGGLQELEIDAPAAGLSAGRHAVMILLTDGQPCPSPPAGEVEELRRYLAARDAGSPKTDSSGAAPRRACKLVTMGFGYDVNSKLLVQLAETHGQGCGNDFAFIPDGTMLLTNFVNLMANIKSTCARRLVLRVVPAAKPAADSITQAMDVDFPDGAQMQSLAHLPSIFGVAGEAVWSPLTCSTGTGMQICLGDVQYGQARDVMLKARCPLPAAAWQSWKLEVAFEPVIEAAAAPCTVSGRSEKPMLDVPAVTQQLHRALAVSAIHQAARVAAVDLDAAQDSIKVCALKTMNVQAGPELQGLAPHPILEDLLGQVSEAISSPAMWSRWGNHYLQSLLSAHKAQSCNNFKDAGVLAYGSQHSRSCRDQLNSMCDSLPVPVPSIHAHGVAVGQPVSSATFLSHFNNAYGGCFGPDTMVLMSDGSSRAIQDLRKGNLVATPEGLPAAVLCVVTYSGVQTVRLPGSGLRITPWHPVRLAGAWQFPAHVMAKSLAAAGAGAQQLLEASLDATAAVYNLVLEAGHVVVVDGVEAVTLGHGLQGEVVKHPFFGTDAVLKELRAQPGWEQGWVDLGCTAWARDADTGLATGFAARADTGSSRLACSI